MNTSSASQNKKILQKRFSNCLAMAMLLTLGIYAWMNFSWNFALEESFAKVNIFIKHAVDKRSDLPYKNSDIFFIDVSKATQFYEDQNGKDIITDRSKLDTLFRLFRQHIPTDKIILCDIYFQVATSQDASLQRQMLPFENLITLNHTDEDGRLLANAIKAGTQGVSNYSKIENPILIFSNSLLKFKLVNESGHRSLPLILFEKANNLQTHHQSNVLGIGKEWYFNSIVHYDHLQLDTESELYKQQIKPLDSLIKWMKEGDKFYLKELRQKRFVVIGNFKDDVHDTLTGSLPGPVIVFNLFLSLQKGENRLYISWLIISVLVLAFACYKIWYQKFFFQKYFKWLDRLALKLGFQSPVSLTWLLIYSYVVISYILLGIDMQFVATIVFLKLVIFFTRTITYRFLKYKRRNHEENDTNLSTAGSDNGQPGSAH